MSDQELTQDQLKLYLKGWRKIRSQAYRDLVASYTPEQKEISERMNHAAAQAALCVTRIDSPIQRTVRTTNNGSRHRTLSWPADPAKE